uniref:Uncharacterized protein n=1 Tax=Oryza glaberrima TaxID=4538 RepID=I1PGS5_ORYGL
MSYFFSLPLTCGADGIETTGAWHGTEHLPAASAAAMAELATVQSRWALGPGAHVLARLVDLAAVDVGTDLHGGGSGELPLEGGVLVILDGVVGAAGEEPHDGGPPVAEAVTVQFLVVQSLAPCRSTSRHSASSSSGLHGPFILSHSASTPISK